MSLATMLKRIFGESRSAARAKESTAAGPKPPHHRSYVGGNWDKIGRLQFDFLLNRGVLPEHYVLDIACGSLRVGRFLIDYLAPEHYLGIDKEQWLIDSGLKAEIAPGVVEAKRPRLVVSSEFEFEKFGVSPDIAWAQSLFTHLTPDLIKLCLTKLRSCIAANGVFYATIFECAVPRENARDPHDKDGFWYTAQQMKAFGEETGWTMEYIGDWEHPRGQRMLEYRPSR